MFEKSPTSGTPESGREIVPGPVQQAYDAGYDAAINGANETNCHFSLFSSPEKTAAWERGRDSALAKARGEKE